MHTTLETRLNIYVKEISQIDTILRLYEEIFPMDMNEIYMKYPRLDSIISKYRNSKESLNKGDIKMLKQVIRDIRESNIVCGIKADIMNAVHDLYQIIFPETGVEKFVKFLTQQEALNDYQQLLLAPSKGIERALGSIISLLNPGTYIELRAGLRYMTGQSYQNVIHILSLMSDQFKQLNSLKQASIGAQFLANSIFLFGGVSKIMNVLNKYQSISMTVSVGALSQKNFRDFSKIATFLRLIENIEVR